MVITFVRSWISAPDSTGVAHGRADERLHHVGSVGSEVRAGRRKNLDVSGKRDCREGEKGGNNLLHVLKDIKMLQVRTDGTHNFLLFALNE